MATGFLILHGVENHRSPEHWQFLLAAQLVGHGLEVRYPALPEPDAPELERWLATLEQELAALGGEQRVVGAKRVGLGTAWVSAKEQVLMPGSPTPDARRPSAEPSGRRARNREQDWRTRTMNELSRDILQLIGNTSLIALRNIVPRNGSRILLKLESENPTGSIKDRMALAMIEAEIGRAHV